MPKLTFRQAAIDDLNDIWEYTFEKWSEKQADKYYSSLKFACMQIGDNPELGKEYSEIRKNLLGLRTGKHIIFYQAINKKEVEIIRILHERMDFETRMSIDR
jgi:toxin ParE1/3/4